MPSALLSLQSLPVTGGPGAPPTNRTDSQWWQQKLKQDWKGMELSTKDLQSTLGMPVHSLERPPTAVRTLGSMPSHVRFALSHTFCGVAQVNHLLFVVRA